MVIVKELEVARIVYGNSKYLGITANVSFQNPLPIGNIMSVTSKNAYFKFPVVKKWRF